MRRILATLEILPASMARTRAMCWRSISSRDNFSISAAPPSTVRHNDFVLKFWHEPYELTLFPDGRAIIKGTTDTAIARSLYARFVGS